MKDDNLTTAFLNLITGELKTSYELDEVHLSDLGVFNVDLSPLRLRLSTDVPCIQITRADLERHGYDGVVEIARQEVDLRQERPGSSLVLAEMTGDFLEPLAKDPYWAVVLDRSTMSTFLEHSNPRRALQEAIQERIPLRFLSPYEPSQPVTGSRFYGRTYELNVVLSHPERSYTIEGGRRIGKTSLLHEIRRRLRKRLKPSQHNLLVSYDFWGYTGMDAFLAEAMRQLDFVPKPAIGGLVDYFPRFIKLMKKKYGGRVVFFLDEIDDLIEHERRHGYQLLSMLKRIATDDDCSCLLAGFRLLTEEQYRYSSPISFCQRLSLANLTLAQAQAMLIAPMQSMNIDLPPEVFRKVLGETGGHPQLLQLFGHSIIELLDRENTRRVTLRHINEIVSSGAVYDKLVETLKDNTDDLEFALICSLAEREDFTQADVNAVLESHDIDLQVREINSICRSLESIGVIQKVGMNSGVYQFSIPLQPALAARQKGIVDMAWQKAVRRHRADAL